MREPSRGKATKGKKGREPSSGKGRVSQAAVKLQRAKKGA